MGWPRPNRRIADRPASPRRGGGGRNRTPAPRRAPRNRRAGAGRRLRPPVPHRVREGGARRRRRCQPCTVRLSATDISALASMKNVAKCDTWCELQNPANHRVFERKLRPRPFGRGHICLGVKQLVSRRLPPCRLRARSLSEMRVGWAESGRPCACSACGWLKSPGHGLRAAQRVVVVRSQGRDCQHAAPFASGLPGKYPTRSKRPIHGSIRIATPSQVGLPAELKHINKRRRRNLRGFP